MKIYRHSISHDFSKVTTTDHDVTRSPDGTLRSEDVFLSDERLLDEIFENENYFAFCFSQNPNPTPFIQRVAEGEIAVADKVKQKISAAEENRERLLKEIELHDNNATALRQKLFKSEKTIENLIKLIDGRLDTPKPANGFTVKIIVKRR